GFEAQLDGPKARLLFLVGDRLVGRIVFADGVAPQIEKVDPEFQAPLGEFIEGRGAIDSGITATTLDPLAAQTLDARLKIQRDLVRAYAGVTPWLVLLGLAAFAVRLWWLARGRWSAGVFVLAALYGAIAARVLLIALADVTSMPSIQPKHFTAVAPLLYVTALLSLA